jgi:non-ribosomal peptide synthase protein (TIGR01720 family)
MRDDEVCQVRITLDEGDGGYDFLVSSRGLQGGNDDGWQNHAMGKVATRRSASRERVDLDEIKQRCKLADKIIAEEDMLDNDLGPRWQSVKRVFLGENELLAAIELAEEFSHDLSEYALHPALMDRAAGTGMFFLVEREGSYLPFSYRKLTVLGPLARRIYTHAVYKKDDLSNKETVSFDIKIMDQDGFVLVDIEDFSHKRINEIAKGVKALVAGSYSAAYDADQQPHVARPAVAVVEQDNVFQRAMSEGLMPAEGVEAFTRILAKNVPPQIVVSPNDLHAAIKRFRQVKQSLVAEEAEALHLSAPLHARPDVETDYVAPRNDTEKKIAAIWQEMLGIDRVGLHDNFFDLGGDSVLAIQIMARANKAGLKFTVQQLFQYQTVSELAEAAGQEGSRSGEAGSQDAAVPLLPFQRWLLEKHDSHISSFGMAMVIDLGQAADIPAVERAAKHLVANHEALRIRFEHVLAGWQQFVSESLPPVPLEAIDLSDLPTSEQSAAIEAHAEKMKSGLDPRRGISMRMALFGAGADGHSKLLIITHPLVADLASQEIILENFNAAYMQIRRGEQVRLAEGSLSFRRLAQELDELSRSALIMRGGDDWLNRDRQPITALPSDMSASGNGAAARGVVSVSLAPEKTARLTNASLRAYNTRVEDFILTALTQAFQEMTGDSTLLVDCCQRMDALEGMDLMRVIAPLTTYVPFELTLPRGSDLGEFIKSIKEQCRDVSRRALSYSLLRHLGDEKVSRLLGSMYQAQLKFSYLGRIDDLLPERPMFKSEEDDSMNARGHAGAGDHFIEVRSFISSGRLVAQWHYAGSKYKKETMGRFAESFINYLTALIDHCSSLETTGYTPSDFPLAGLSDEKIAKISKLLERSDEALNRLKAESGQTAP